MSDDIFIEWALCTASDNTQTHYKRCTAITSFYFLMLALLNLGWGVSSVQFEEGPVESHAECVPASVTNT